MLKEISIEIIRKCANKCCHCSSSSGIECNEIIPFDVFKRVVDSAAKMHLQTLCFSGGEPFLHPDIVKMVQYVNLKGIQTYIYTSGIYLSGETQRGTIPQDILLSIKGKVTKLIFNVEAATESTYNKIMGTTGCLPYLEQTIHNAVSLGITCEAHFVPMKLNINEIESTINFCEQHGISKVSFLRLVPHGRALQNKDLLMLNSGELNDLKEKLNRIKCAGKHSVRIGVPLSSENTEAHCEAAIGKLNIKFDGFVYPCEVFKNTQDESHIIAQPDNIWDKDLEDIYCNSSYLNYIRSFTEKFGRLSTCENCVGQFYIQLLSKKGEENAE